MKPADLADLLDRTQGHLIAGHPVKCGGRSVSVTASLGVSEFRSDDTLEDCLKRADENLYRAKRAGRNRIVA